MRVIDYYNIGAFALIALAALYARYSQQSNAEQGDRYVVHQLPLRALMSIILGAGLFLRIILPEALPYGLQQDEASIGYEAYCLANYGIDRHGYAYPVYPITWGSGGGSPLMIYLNVITSRIMGSSVASIRFVPALLGIFTLYLFYDVIRRTHDEKTALAGLALLTFCPWHIILSRWSLDSNTMPFFEIWMIYMLLRGTLAEAGRLRWYIGGCVLAGVCLYDYGSATIVVPLFLILYVSLLFRRHRITIKEAVLSAASFLVTCIPIGIFYAVQYLGLPEINLSWISFNRFTASHASAFVSFNSSLPRAILTNLVDIVRVLTIGVTDEDRWNAMPEYAALYKYMLPFLVIGLLCAIRTSAANRTDDADPECAAADIFLCMFLAAALFGLFIHVDINRMVMIFLPAIYLETLGLRWLIRSLRKCRAGLAISIAVACLLLTGFVSFAKDYYGGYYNNYASNVFMPGYGEAMRFADEQAQAMDLAHTDRMAAPTTIYSTYTDVASPFMITLFYTQYNPYEFMDTAVWRDLGSEFQIATAFGHFVFGLPENAGSADYADDIFVVTGSEAQLFADTDRSFITFGNFTVVLPGDWTGSQNS